MSSFKSSRDIQKKEGGQDKPKKCKSKAKIMYSKIKDYSHADKYLVANDLSLADRPFQVSIDISVVSPDCGRNLVYTDNIEEIPMSAIYNFSQKKLTYLLATYILRRFQGSTSLRSLGLHVIFKIL